MKQLPNSISAISGGVYPLIVEKRHDEDGRWVEIYPTNPFSYPWQGWSMNFAAGDRFLIPESRVARYDDDKVAITYYEVPLVRVGGTVRSGYSWYAVEIEYSQEEHFKNHWVGNIALPNPFGLTGRIVGMNNSWYEYKDLKVVPAGNNPRQYASIIGTPENGVPYPRVLGRL